jgi:hypothetical protein
MRYPPQGIRGVGSGHGALGPLVAPIPTTCTRPNEQHLPAGAGRDGREALAQIDDDRGRRRRRRRLHRPGRPVGVDGACSASPRHAGCASSAIDGAIASILACGQGAGHPGGRRNTGSPLHGGGRAVRGSRGRGHDACTRDARPCRPVQGRRSSGAEAGGGLLLNAAEGGQRPQAVCGGAAIKGRWAPAGSSSCRSGDARGSCCTCPARAGAGRACHRPS